MKRFLSAVLAAAMLLVSIPAAFAASDIDKHWSRTYITALNKQGVINPASDGTYKPDQAIMRWEFMRYINRAFGFTEKAQISFTDVKSSDTYYSTVQTAVEYGYINGVGDDKMDPTGTLTREQAATILGRLHKYTPTGTAAAMSFTDKDKISKYAVSYVAEAVDKGYINGYTDGSFMPQRAVTRGEIAKILYFFMGSSLHTANGTLTESDFEDDTKNASISAAGTLSDATVEGNLYITEGVTTGTVNLRNVKVEGDIIVSGGDVTMDGVSAARMVVKNPRGITPQITCTGNTNIGKTEVLSSGTLRESGLDVSAGGLSDLTLDGENLSLTLDAQVWDINVEKPASLLTTGSTEINTLTCNAKVAVTGGGSIQKAVLNASGCELLMKPGSYELMSGVTATIAGESVSSSNGVTVSPGTFSFDINNTDTLAHSYDFSFGADKNDLQRVECDGKTLSQGTDYNLLTDKNGIRVYKKYLTTLKAGTFSMDLIFRDGSKGAILISTVDSALTAVSPSKITYDKYDGSANHTELSVTVTLPTGTTLSSVKIGSTVLERGTDYVYDGSSGLVTFKHELLDKKNTGSYTISFVPSRGATHSCTLEVTDTSPVNTVSPAEADFDANTQSGGYADLTVSLVPADDAELKYIRCNGKTLEEDWQYVVNGSTVKINRSAVSDFAENNANYADFTFVMTKGKNPTLRVNFVTTFALTAQVVDDLGLPIEGVVVSFTPTETEKGTPAQNATTDKDGKATVYVKRGSYTLAASDSRFTNPISQTLSVSSGRTVKLTGEILETVEITVTDTTGAKLSGAVVTIGGKSVTTGADGLAAFTVKRANYTAQVTCSGYTMQTLPLIVNGTVRERVILK